MASATRKVRIYQRSDGRWEWQLRARNGKRMCGSEPQGFNTWSDARRAWITTEDAIKLPRELPIEIVGVDR